MGFFSWLKGEKFDRKLATRFSYDAAYYVLPQYMCSPEHSVRIRKMTDEAPSLVGKFFFTMAAAGRNLEPSRNMLDVVLSERGRWDDEHTYLLIIYPEPEPVRVDPNSMNDIASMIEKMKSIVLGPYMSLLVFGPDMNRTFVLNQTVQAGATNLREVTNNANGSYGEGPAADDAQGFIAKVQQIVMNPDDAGMVAFHTRGNASAPESEAPE